MKYQCSKCKFIFDEKVEGKCFKRLDKDFVCPFCNTPKKDFIEYTEVEKDTSKAILVEKNNPSLEFIKNKCSNCGLCKRVCEGTVGIKYDINDVKRPICINCGQCILNCPTAALQTKYDYKKVLSYINNDKYIVTISVAPAIRVSIGDEFGKNVGDIVTKKLVGLLKKIGFDYVFDLTYGADLTVMEEGMELTQRLNENRNLPLFTSCCPSWVKYATIYHPELLNNLSSTKSPIGMQGAIINNYFFKKNKNNKKIINVMLAPCTAKKMEILSTPDINYCITTKELGYMCKELNLTLDNALEEDFDSMFKGSGAGVIFGTSGGVLTAATRCCNYYINGTDIEDIKLTDIESIPNAKEATININGSFKKIACCYTMPSLEKLLLKKDEYIMIEVMNCYGGCVGGGGESLINIPLLKEASITRGNNLKNIDKKMTIRYPYKNPDILRLYSDFLKYPCSDIAHKYLHTSFKENKSYLK